MLHARTCQVKWNHEQYLTYVENCRPGSYKARPNIPSYKVFKASNIVLKRAHLFTKGADMGPIYVLPGIILSRPPVIHCLYLGRYATLPVNQTYTSAPKEEQHITSHHYIQWYTFVLGKWQIGLPAILPFWTVLSSPGLIVPLDNGPFYNYRKAPLRTIVHGKVFVYDNFARPRKPTLKPRKSKMRKRRYSTSPVPHASRRSGDEASCLLNKNPCHNPRLGNRVQGTTCDLKALVPDAWRPWPTTIYFSIFLQSPYHIPLPTLYLHSQHPSTSLSLQAPIYFINQLGLKYRLRFISCITTFRTVQVRNKMWY